VKDSREQADLRFYNGYKPAASEGIRDKYNILKIN
jgi:hypothetical protein